MTDAGSLAGMSGPVLVLADNPGIAAAAPRWAAEFAAAGLVHRVRLVDSAGEHDLAAVLSEAEQLGARAILAVGSGGPLSLGTSASTRLGLPLLVAHG